MGCSLFIQLLWLLPSVGCSRVLGVLKLLLSFGHVALCRFAAACSRFCLFFVILCNQDTENVMLKTASLHSIFQTGCSVRLLNPQTYHDDTWRLLSTLQELFGSGMGANVYLTPPNSQGFAPHYDDIEAFVLQLEGKKRWRIYRSRYEADLLGKLTMQHFVFR